MATKAKSKKGKGKGGTLAVTATTSTRAPKRTDKELVLILVENLKGHGEESRSVEQVYQETRIDWYTVRRLFQANSRIFQATSETKRARYTLTAAAVKAKSS